MKKYNVQGIFTRISSKIFLLLGLSFLFLGLVYAGLFSSLSPNPSGQVPGGTFSGRLTNMLVSCPAGQFLKGFDVNLNPVCATPYGAGSSSPQIPAPTIFGGYPSAPSGQMIGGKFANYFHNISGTCSGNGIVKGFASDGTKYCVDPVQPTASQILHTVLRQHHISDLPIHSDNPLEGNFRIISRRCL